MTKAGVPTDVLRALEILEQASSPTELGPSYQVLLDWRRGRPFRVFAINAAMPVVISALLGGSYLFFSLVEVPNTEFWRGVQFGLAASLFVSIVSNLISPRRQPPMSMSSRIEAAIDRWRHAAPAMRELPR